MKILAFVLLILVSFNASAGRLFDSQANARYQLAAEDCTNKLAGRDPLVYNSYAEQRELVGEYGGEWNYENYTVEPCDMMSDKDWITVQSNAEIRKAKDYKRDNTPTVKRPWYDRW